MSDKKCKWTAPNGQVACVDIEIFKAGYKTCEAEMIKLYGQFWEMKK